MSFTDRLGFTVSQAIAAWVLVFLVGGAAGVVAMLLCHYLMTFGGEDSADKHGISKVTASRVGGVAVVGYMLIHLGYQYFAGLYTPSFAENSVFLTAVAFFALGFFEDLRGNLSAKLRFGLMALMAAGTLLLSPHLILGPVGIFFVDAAVSTQITALLFTALCVAYIPNAFNTADGANGLVSGVSLATLTGLSAVAPPELLPFIASGAVGCLIFMIFNVISGRFFLGDGGAYFLGAFCGLSVVLIANQTDASVWWLLSMIFYPVADLMWSMGRRVMDRKSPFEPDNQHFHNVLFAWLDTDKRTSVVANTTCGIGIAVVFAGLPLAIFSTGLIAVDSLNWFWVVVLQWLVYGAGWRHLNQRLCLLPNDLQVESSSVQSVPS